MLSAQKEEVRLKVVTGEKNVSSLGSFGKVVNSIQGLQQRLGDFTVDDLSQANDKIRTLIFQLADMQGRLNRLANINQYAAKTKTAIDNIPSHSIDLSQLVDLDRPLQLHTLIQASKLIRFPGLSKGVMPNNASESTFPPQQESQNPPWMADTAAAVVIPTGSAQDLLKPTVSKVSVIATEAPTSEPETLKLDLSVQNAERIEVSREQVPITQGKPSIEDEYTSSLGLISPSTRELPASTRPAEIEIVATKSPELAASGVAIEATSIEAPSVAPINVDFDQRLLDDLIKNYGEFAASFNLPATIAPLNNTAENADHVNAPQVHFEEQTRKDVATLKQHGELDRKLKKLIKDYGEYDLYSRQSPVNLKMGVIGAFLLLGVVFSGFYIFSSPKLHDASPVSSAEPSNSKNDDANAKSPSPDASKATITSSPNTAVMELQKSAEASDSHEVNSKNHRKQNK